MATDGPKDRLVSSEDFGALPPQTELDRRWKEVVNDFGENVGGPLSLASLSSAQKWQIICCYELQQKARLAEHAADSLGVDGGGGGEDANGLRLGNLLREDDDELRRFKQTPTRWVERLRAVSPHVSLAADRLPLDTAQDLKLQLRAASGQWLKEFYDLGGLAALVEVTSRAGRTFSLKQRPSFAQPFLQRCSAAYSVLAVTVFFRRLKTLFPPWPCLA